MKNLSVFTGPYAIPAHSVVCKIGPAVLKNALTKAVNDFLPYPRFLGAAVICRFVQHDLCDHLHLPR